MSILRRPSLSTWHHMRRLPSRYGRCSYLPIAHKMVQPLLLIFLLCVLPSASSLVQLDSSAWTPSTSKPLGRIPAERSVVLLYNKPPDVVTSHVSENSRPTVYEEIQSMRGFATANCTTHPPLTFEQATGIRSKLHAIGRLDVATSGVLLLTNDGALVHHATNPNALQRHGGTAVTKTYEALIMGRHTEESLSAVRDGVDIGTKYGGVTRPVNDLTILGHPNHKSTLVSITISEGRNRQVRRMFHAVGSGVMRLRRTRIGEELTLQGVDEGQWRVLSDHEVKTSLNWEAQLLPQEAPSILGKKVVPSRNGRRGSNRRRLLK